MSGHASAIDGACHCGAVQFRVVLPGGLAGPVRCNCSYCRMKGAVMLFAGVKDITITQGADRLCVYRFGSQAARHYFCGTCGIHTHHQRRFDPAQIAVNAACLAGVSPFDFAELRVLDGHIHPLDHGGGALGVAGVLRYVPGGAD